jgi:hypothetical protein
LFLRTAAAALRLGPGASLPWTVGSPLPRAAKAVNKALAQAIELGLLEGEGGE